MSGFEFATCSNIPGFDGPPVEIRFIGVNTLKLTQIHMRDHQQTANQVEAALREKTNPEKAAFFPRFFKTGPGEYGEGDQFIGVIVPDQRKIATQFKQLPQDQIIRLLHSPWHECRLTALLIMVHQFQKGDQATRKRIYELYLKNTDRINNWDLVDASAHKIVGPYLQDRDRKKLRQLARARHLWKNRIAIVATYHYIKQDDFDDILELSEMLIEHPHDLIHKAIGWMLREMGKRDVESLRRFLKLHGSRMPRTMLRYSIEKFPNAERKRFLAGEF